MEQILIDSGNEVQCTHKRYCSTIIVHRCFSIGGVPNNGTGLTSINISKGCDEIKSGKQYGKN
jgi:hypothetical protein